MTHNAGVRKRSHFVNFVAPTKQHSAPILLVVGGAGVGAGGNGQLGESVEKLKFGVFRRLVCFVDANCTPAAGRSVVTKPLALYDIMRFCGPAQFDFGRNMSMSRNSSFSVPPTNAFEAVGTALNVGANVPLADSEPANAGRSVASSSNHVTEWHQNVTQQRTT